MSCLGQVVMEAEGERRKWGRESRVTDLPNEEEWKKWVTKAR